MSKAPSPVVAWNPSDYAANSASQHSWARELIARLNLRGNEHILDVGCGDGKVTAELAGAVPFGAAVGIDSSPAMIRFAQQKCSQSSLSNLRFEIMDARQIQLNQTFDLIFSNAALHWVDDHQAFLRGASACLKSGGRLVVSCGGTGNAQDVFTALRSTMRLKRWREFFRDLERPYFFYSVEDYAAWLPRAGFQPKRVELADKKMKLESVEKFSGWLRTTWLPYTQRLPEHLRDAFIAAVVERYLISHPPDSENRVSVGMVRLEIDAVKV